jgi:hypothetical protein
MGTGMIAAGARKRYFPPLSAIFQPNFRTILQAAARKTQQFAAPK